MPRCALWNRIRPSEKTCRHIITYALSTSSCISLILFLVGAKTFPLLTTVAVQSMIVHHVNFQKESETVSQIRASQLVLCGAEYVAAHSYRS